MSVADVLCLWRCNLSGPSAHRTHTEMETCTLLIMDGGVMTWTPLQNDTRLENERLFIDLSLNLVFVSDFISRRCVILIARTCT